MNKFKYFFYGYPKNPRAPVYALYQPVFDCFLLVIDDLEVAQRIRAYAPSRYQVTIVRLDQAVNYTANLIDNEVCEHWSLQNKSAVNLFENDNQGCVVANQLVPATPTIDWDIVKEKRWLMMLTFYIKFFDSVRSNAYYQSVERAMADLPVDPKLALGPRHIREEVFKEIYLGLDLESIENTITQHIMSNRWVANDYNRFLESYQ